MRARLRAWMESLQEVFWLRPALLVTLGVVAAEVLVRLDGAFSDHEWAPSGWIYAGGESGARALLGAIASSAIGVAGTVFSITIAALSLASGQMGPRLLRNFMRDRGNQMALGIFLGTFAYVLMVLRTVRSVEEDAFVPHLAVTGALLLALLCVATLVWFVHHIASGINVERVIEDVHHELVQTMDRLLPREEPPEPGTARPPEGGRPVRASSGGYIRSLDTEGLADWAAEKGLVVRLLMRPGEYVSQGMPLAEVAGEVDGEEAAGRVCDAFILGERQAAGQDLEFAVRQLVEIGDRALSPSSNDPFTAIAVINRLVDILCRVADRPMPAPVLFREGRARVFRRVTTYDGLCDAMFHILRQDMAGSAPVLIHLLESLGQVSGVEHRPERLAALRRHAGLVLEAGRRTIEDPAGLVDFERRRARYFPAL